MKEVSAVGKASRSFDLDFLRGLFVLGILVYHIVPGAPVGLGQGSMEGFFCLSGYLITRTLLRRIPLGWPGLGDFAINRLRRLMPALLLYLLLVGVLNLGFQRADLETVLKSTAFSVFGFYNWFQISQGAALQGLGGIWSLSVEDQFYMIVMAAAAVLIWQKTSKKAVQVFFVLYIGFLILSLGVRFGNQFWWPGQSSEMISYSTFPRLWSFGWGGLAALATDSYQTRSHRAFDLFLGKRTYLWLGFAILAGLAVRNYNEVAFLSGWLVIGVATAGCILGLAIRKKTERPLFGIMPLSLFVAKIGVACYPIYLFQAFEKNIATNLQWQTSFTLSLILGLAIHEYIEVLYYPYPKYQHFFLMPISKEKTEK